VSSAERKAANEARFRLVNERIEDAALDAGLTTQAVEFVCECANPDCAELITMSLAAYERIRQDTELFVIVPGHDQADVEDVISEQEGFVVVRKEGEAAAVAHETDPRS
jgi:hypothetical protein